MTSSVSGNVVAYSYDRLRPKLKENIEPSSPTPLGEGREAERLHLPTFYKTSWCCKRRCHVDRGTPGSAGCHQAVEAASVEAGDDNETEYDIVQYDQLHALRRGREGTVGVN